MWQVGSAGGSVGRREERGRERWREEANDWESLPLWNEGSSSAQLLSVGGVKVIDAKSKLYTLHCVGLCDHARRPRLFSSLFTLPTYLWSPPPLWVAGSAISCSSCRRFLTICLPSPRCLQCFSEPDVYKAREQTRKHRLLTASEVLSVLPVSLWSEVQMICIWSS